MSNTNKHKNSVVSSGLSLLKNSFVALGITSLVIAGGLVGFDSIQKDQKSAQAAPVSGSSTLGGANSVSLDKKYLSGTSETENLSVSPNGTVTVRVKYNNTGNQSVTDAQIKDSLPAGFVYQAGSFKNCITPTTAEEVCDTFSSSNKDTAFGNLTGTGLSPVSGLYDAVSAPASGGTAVSANSGILEIGKNRYINVNQCFTAGFGYDTFGAGVSNVNAPYASDCSLAYPGYTKTGGGATDMLNRRYGNALQCSTTGTEGTDTFIGTASNTSGEYPSAINNGGCDTFNMTASRGYSRTGGYGIELLGQRYLNALQCFTPTTGYDIFIGRASNTVGAYPTTGTNSGCGDFAMTAALGYSRSGGYGLDMLDTARGSGYMEYKMMAPATVGTFGTGVTLASTATTGANPLSTPASDAFVSGSANTITLGAAPTLGTSIPTVSSPLTGSVGSLMPSIALSGSNIPDGTQATFTPAGSTPITGTMQGGQFIPTLGSLIPTNATLGATTGVLKSAGVPDLNIPTNFTAQGTTSPLSTSDLSTISTMNCGTPVINSTATCTFTLPANKTLPSDFKMGIGDATPGGTCTTVGSTVTCANIPTGSQIGQQIIYGQISGVKVATASKANVGSPTITTSSTATSTTSVATTPTPTVPTPAPVAPVVPPTTNNIGSTLPLTAVDFNTIPVICNSGASIAVNSKATCTFTLPDTRNLPNDFKIGIGDATPGGYCSVFGNQVTCREVPTGSQTGTQLLYVQTGNDTKISTGKSFIIGNYSMLKCEAGKMSQNQSCVDCPIGFYCDGGSDVMACGKGTTTWYTGSRGSADCSRIDGSQQNTQVQVYSNNNGSGMVTTTVNSQSNKTIRTGGINLFSGLGIVLITLASIGFWAKSKNGDSINLLK